MESFCVGGRKNSATTKLVGDITFKGQKVLVGLSSIYEREMSMTVSGTTKQTEGLSDFSRI